MYNNKYDDRHPENVKFAHEKGHFAHKLYSTWHMRYEADMYSTWTIRRIFREECKDALFGGYAIEVGSTARRELGVHRFLKHLMAITDKADESKLKAISEHKYVGKFEILNVSTYLQNTPMLLEHLFSSRFLYGNKELFLEHKKHMFQKIRSEPEKYSFKSSLEYQHLIENLSEVRDIIDSYLISLVATSGLGDEFFLGLSKNTSKKIETLYNNKLLDLEFWQADTIIYSNLEYLLIHEV